MAAARERVDTLTQSFLAKAFRSEVALNQAELARREWREYEPDRLVGLKRDCPQGLVQGRRTDDRRRWLKPERGMHRSSR